MSVGNSIIVRAERDNYDEGVLAAIAKPGMNIVLGSAGTYTPGVGLAQTAIVIEDALQGKTMSDAYASGDLVRFITPEPGDRVHLLCLSGEDISVGEGVKANSAGKYVQLSSGDVAQFFARESSGGALGADTLLMCEKV